MHRDVLVLTSSARPQSSTARLGAVVADQLAAAGHRPALAHAGQIGLPLCTGAGPTHTAVERWRRQAAAYDVHVWVSAEWHGSFPGALKNALDHLTEDDLRGAVVGLVAQAGGSLPPLNTISHLRTVAQQLGAWLLPTSVAATAEQLGPTMEPILLRRIERMAADIAAGPSGAVRGPLAAG